MHLEAPRLILKRSVSNEAKQLFYNFSASGLSLSNGQLWAATAHLNNFRKYL